MCTCCEPEVSVYEVCVPPPVGLEPQHALTKQLQVAVASHLQSKLAGCLARLVSSVSYTGCVNKVIARYRSPEGCMIAPRPLSSLTQVHST